MADNRDNLGRHGYCPEVTQGVDNSAGEVAANVVSGSAITVAAASGSAFYPPDGSAAKWLNILAGCYLYFQAGTQQAGKAVLITGCTWLANVLTITVDKTYTATDKIDAADLFQIIGVLRSSGISSNFGVEKVSLEEFLRQNYERPPSERGLPVVNGSMSCYLPPLASAITSTTSELDVYSQFLDAFCDRRIVPGTVITGGASSATKADVTSATPYSVGDRVMINGEVRRIADIDTGSTPNELIFDTALSSIPSAADVIYGSEQYVPYETDQRTFTIIHLLDQQLIKMMGCQVSIAIESVFGEFTKMNVEFDGTNFSVADDSDTTDGIPLVCGPVSGNRPKVHTRSAMHFATVIYPNMTQCSLDMGIVRSNLRDDGATLTDGGQSFLVTDRQATMGATFRNRNKTWKTVTEATGVVGELQFQIGIEATACLCLSAQAQPSDPSSLTSVENVSYHDATFDCVDRSESCSLKRKPTINRF